jgi:hypothetical protein
MFERIVAAAAAFVGRRSVKRRCRSGERQPPRSGGWRTRVSGRSSWCPRKPAGSLEDTMAAAPVAPGDLVALVDHRTREVARVVFCSENDG